MSFEIVVLFTFTVLLFSLGFASGPLVARNSAHRCTGIEPVSQRGQYQLFKTPWACSQPKHGDPKLRVPGAPVVRHGFRRRFPAPNHSDRETASIEAVVSKVGPLVVVPILGLPGMGDIFSQVD